MSHPTNSRSDVPQEDFWSAHPCGADGSFADRVAFRYHREPWLRSLIEEVATRHSRVLEIGCGQGIDGIGICSHMSGGRYLGIDYSVESVRMAQLMLAEARRPIVLRVQPEFRVGSAIDLNLPDDSFDCVYSIGVMHHTPSVRACLKEAYRVLEPGGIAYIALYRKYSIKVSGAKLLRGVQSIVDQVVGTERSIYRLLRRRGPSSLSGTMFLECFGVPFMDWYTRTEIMDMLSSFEVMSVDPVGANLLHRYSARSDVNAWGYMWLIRAKRPAVVPAPRS